MPATHHIDKKNKLIVTAWDGEPTIQDLSQAFNIYQVNIKSKSEFMDYDELIDFSKIRGFKLSADDLKILAYTASRFDESIANCKLAIVVKSNLTFVLARMYGIYRSLSPKNKDIRVFINKTSALTWLANNKNQA